MSVTMTKENMAKHFLDELIARSLIQVGEIDSSGRVRTCGIHDVLHEFLRTRARDQEFVGFSCQSGMISHSQRLFIGSTSSGDANTLLTTESLSSHIRSLLVFGGSSIATFLNKVKLLEVLDLEGADLLREDVQVEAVTDLFFFRYLSLRGNYNISSLPYSLEKLINLETLDIKFTGIPELPLGIIKLKCLRHLLIDYSMRVLVGIGCLTTLEKLRAGVIGYKGISKELNMLTRLRTLDIYRLDGDEGRNVLAAIEKMKFLHAFNMGLMESRLKDYTSFFKGLQFQLPKLVVLILDGAFDGMAESLWFKKGGFTRLGHLGLWDLPDLNLIQIEEGALPVIKHMALLRCTRLELPMGIEHLITTTLKKISVYDLPTRTEDAMRNHRQNTETYSFIITDIDPFAYLEM